MLRLHNPRREGICEMRLSHSAKDISAQFDDPNLVSCAGLEPVMRGPAGRRRYLCPGRLPMGVTADMVADRRARMAANLGRAKLETWPAEAHEAGVLDLWVADKGSLGRGAGPWPLLHDGDVDVFDGVPFGRSQRGQVLAAPLLERNYLIGGMPGQG